MTVTTPIINKHNISTDIIAVILCGGMSSRMGKDKGLITNQNGIPWSWLLAERCLSLYLPTYISIREEQYSFYKSLFVNASFIIDSIKNIPGPLCGILSVFHSLNLKSNQKLLVLACDMPNLEIQYLQWIIGFCREHNNYDAWIGVQEKNSLLEPLCGIYSYTGLSKIKATIEKTSIFKLQYLLRNINIQTFSINIFETNIFKNYNSPEQIEAEFQR